ncbi:MAG: TrmH family RNA methyltransferase [Patescibacteria group bacterium]
MSRKHNEIVLVLDNIRSVHNVGAIFRTADAAGVSKIILAGYTPGPIDRFGRSRADFKKAALGAEESVKWESAPTALAAISKLKTKNFYILALEQGTGAFDYKKIKPKGKTALVVGNEIDGISKEVIKYCDKVAQIPMRGKKESLNVSVALGIALFRIFNL